MDDLTVLLAPRGCADGVLDVLVDMSAVGLVEPFLWVVEEEMTRTALPAIEIRAGRRTLTSLQSMLASRNFRRVRAGVLVALLDGARSPSTQTHHALSELLESSAGGAEVTRARLLIARPGGPAVGSATIEGWHNLLIAPEDSRGPGSGHVLLAPSDDAVVIGQHAAPAIASVLGMWADVDHAPLDGVAPPPGQVIRMVRSFYRRFDTTNAENELRRQVFASGASLPLPRQRGASVSYIDDTALATRQMARALWTKHRDVLRGPRQSPPAATTRKIGLLEAIKMFLGFMWAALKSAPSEWYSGVIRRTSSSVAGAVHSAVYGSEDSAYTVVFNGMTAQGTPVGMTELRAASERLGEAVSGPGEHEARPDLSALWDDFVDGALTLADAGERSEGLPPVQIGANRGVVRSVSDCVASEHDTFVLPSSVAAVVGTKEVPAGDIDALRAVVPLLRAAEGDAMVGGEARGAVDELKQWAAKHGRSYGAQVGQILYDAISKNSREVQELLARIRSQAEDEDISGEIARKQKKLALLMKIFTGVLVIALAAFGGLIGFKMLSALWGAGFMVLSVVAWAVVSAITFMRGQRDLFQELSRRQANADQADADRINLRTASRDLSRVTSAYAQYLAWSRAVGAMLREPFGPEAAVQASRPLIGYGLPLSTKVGSAKPGADAVANAGLQVRRDLFTVGWLTPVWQQLIDDAGNGLGALGQDIRENPRLLYADEGKDTGSPLDVWSARLAHGDLRVTGADPLWERVVTSLASEASDIGKSLSENVESVTDGDRRVVRIEEFMAGLDSGDLGIQYFDDELYTDTAIAAGDTRVATNVRSSAASGLGEIKILTQIGDAIPEFQFGFCRDRAGNSSVPQWQMHPTSAADPFGLNGSDVGPSSSTTTVDPAVEPPGSGTFVF